jgi:2Fe-2S ferredoxin
MPNITFRLGGEDRTVEASVGESVMVVAVRNRIPRIIGECGGEMNCGTCHVYLGPSCESLFPPPSADETDLIGVLDDATDESRLGCQVQIGSVDVIVTVP